MKPSEWVYLAINSEENLVLHKAEKLVQVSLKAVKHTAFVGIKLKEEQLLVIKQSFLFYKRLL